MFALSLDLDAAGADCSGMIVAAPTQLDATQSTELSKMQIGIRLAAVRGCFARLIDRPRTVREQ
jgi:hypothetical protein